MPPLDWIKPPEGVVTDMLEPAESVMLPPGPGFVADVDDASIAIIPPAMVEPATVIVEAGDVAAREMVPPEPVTDVDDIP